MLLWSLFVAAVDAAVGFLVRLFFFFAYFVLSSFSSITLLSQSLSVSLLLDLWAYMHTRCDNRDVCLLTHEQSKVRDRMRLTHLHCQFDESVCRSRDCWSSLFLILVFLFFVSFRFVLFRFCRKHLLLFCFYDCWFSMVSTFDNGNDFKMLVDNLEMKRFVYFCLHWFKILPSGKSLASTFL